MKKSLIIAMALILSILTACTGEDTIKSNEVGQAPSRPVTENGLLSSFSATDIFGSEIDESVLADYDLTMVNVWATFCSPCIREMPDLGELAAQYKEKGVQIVGLVSDVLDSDRTINQDMLNTAREIVDKTKADYIHILPSNDLLGLLSQINSVPTTFFVDKDGNQVGSAYLGSKSKADWEAVIDKTLAEVSK